MPQNSELDRLSVFAKDFARLYVRFTEHFTCLDAITVESFGELFYASRVEYLHYCGGTTLDRPFFPAITDDLLQLSSAYLALPPDASPRAVRTFGLLLTLFLYATQPARPRSSEDADDTAASNDASPPTNAVDGDESGRVEATAPSSPPPLHSPRLPMRTVPISVSCMRLLLSCLSISGATGAAATQPSSSATPPLTYTETKALLTLHRAGAWHVEPYLRDGNHLAALLTAHADCGAPLVRHTAVLLPPHTFAATLAARSIVHASASPAAVGGADSLFRDPEFVRMRLEYEKARQQLLQ